MNKKEDKEMYANEVNICKTLNNNDLFAKLYGYYHYENTKYTYVKLTPPPVQNLCDIPVEESCHLISIIEKGEVLDEEYRPEGTYVRALVDDRLAKRVQAVIERE